MTVFADNIATGYAAESGQLEKLLEQSTKKYIVNQNFYTKSGK